LGEFAGQANRTFVCYVTDTIDDGVVFRLPRQRFKTYLDADRSVKVFLLMNEIGVGPPLLCRLQNGVCYEYVKGKIFTVQNTYEFRDLTVGK
jgi:hypothetical protein